MSRAFTAAGPALSVALLIGCGDVPVEPPPPVKAQVRAQPGGHHRMLSLLRDIATRAPDEHHFVGTRRARALRAEVERLGAKAPWQLRLEAGLADVQLGEERAGIDALSRTCDGLRDGSIAGGDAAATEVAFHLAVSWLRLGETENCCHVPNAESCIMPIRGGGLHERAEGSTRASELLLEVLARTAPDASMHLAAQWLVNLAAMTLGRHPDGVPEAHRIPASAFAPRGDIPRFHNIARGLGLDTMGLAGGVIADDFDGDHHVDIVTSDWHPSGQLRFFANARDGTFQDRTEAAGLLGITGGLNLVQADYDCDGDVDFLVLRGAWLGAAGRHPKSLVRNNGDGTFTDVTFAAGLGDVHYPSQTAAWADYDHDGDLDLYVGNEASATARFPCQLFQNDGDGTFTDVAAQAGVENLRFAKAVTWGDHDGDALPDLYVSNNGQPNRLYANRGDGTFEDVAERAGVTGPEVSFPAWFWDFDNDGALDLYVSCYGTGIAHLAASYLGRPLPSDLARLYRGDGRGGFRDVAAEVGLAYPAMPMGSNFGDLDHDGFLDFYLGTGDPHFFSLMPNLMFLNRGGKRFEDVTMAGGFGHLQKGHAVAFADFDHDGDQDVFEAMGGAYAGDGFRDAFYANPGSGNRWLAVVCEGRESNRSAIGARIRVEVEDGGGARSIFRHVNSGGSFGANPLRQTIGLGKASAIRALEVFWPRTGKTQVVEGAPLDRVIRVVEGDEGFREVAVARVDLRRK